MEKLTAEIKQKIVGAIASGNYHEVACSLAGIDLAVFKEWMIQGEEGIQPYRAFWEEVKRAEAIAEAKRIQVIAKESESNWQAAKWLLEKRFSEKWGKKQQRKESKK